MTVEEILATRMHRVELDDGVHLYWMYDRVTLCGLNKVWAPRVYLSKPTCEACLARVGELHYNRRSAAA